MGKVDQRIRRIRQNQFTASQRHRLRVINRGFGGSQIGDSVKYVDRIVLLYRPKAVVFYAGNNDLAAGKPPERLLKVFQQFVAKVHEALPRTRIPFIGVKPSPSRWKLKDKVIETNRLMEQYCHSDSRLSYVDVYTPMLGTDGLPREELFIADKPHMNRAGYELWAARVKPLVEARASRPATRR